MSQTPPADSVAPKPPRKRRRLLWLSLFGVLLIAGVLFYLNFYLYHPVGTGPAGPPVSRKSFQTVWTEHKVVLLGFGDSVTAGYGASPGRSYFDMLVANPKDDFPEMQGITLSAVIPNLSTNNLAVSGSTSIEHLEIQLPKMPDYSEDVFGIVVATTGGNDVIHMYGRTPPREGAMYGATFQQAEPWIANFETRLNTILDDIASHFPGGHHVFLANIYDPTDGVGDVAATGLPPWPDGKKILGAYNDVIAHTCNRRDDSTLVDIHAAFLGHGIHARQFWRSFYHPEDTGYWYFENLEDPNDRGYDAIRRLFLNQMAKVLPNLLKP